MKLWTFQRKVIVPQVASGDRFLSEWETTPENWRRAYRWMFEQMIAALGICTNTPPVWCWHSCNGRRGKGPTASTARSLLSDWDFNQGMITIELDVPKDFALLSSYYAWNEFLDFIIDHQCLPDDDASTMFAEPLFKHKDDNIQAVIPYIEPDWIVSIRELSITSRDQDESI